MRNTRTKMLGIIYLVALGVLGRLLPHPPNMTPMTALSLWGSANFGPRIAVLIPVITMFVSDFFLGFYNWKILISVYGSFILITYVGRILKTNTNPAAVLSATVASSLLFFLVTNFSVWAFSPWYPKSVAGLLFCYALGIPFFGSMLLGDLFFTSILFGLLSDNFFSRKIFAILTIEAPVRFNK